MAQGIRLQQQDAAKASGTRSGDAAQATKPRGRGRECQPEKLVGEEEGLWPRDPRWRRRRRQKRRERKRDLF